MAKPTFIIVHGAWHRPSHFTPLMQALNSHGYKTLAPALPSVDKAPAETVPDSQEDIATVRRTILDELDNAENDVIVVPHSYGGIPASGAIEGLDPKSRAEEGKKTSVVAIAAITSFILAEGVDIAAIEQRDAPKLPELWGPPPVALFWQDLPVESETQKWAAEQLNIMSMHALYDKCRFSAYKVVPMVHYLMATEDKAISLATQERIVERIRGEIGEGRVRTEVLEGCSHSPFLTRVEETVGFLRRSAGEEV